MKGDSRDKNTFLSQNMHNHSASVIRKNPKSLTRQTKQGDLHSFFHADSENQVFDMRFSLRTKIFFH